MNANEHGLAITLITPFTLMSDTSVCSKSQQKWLTSHPRYRPHMYHSCTDQDSRVLRHDPKMTTFQDTRQAAHHSGADPCPGWKGTCRCSRDPQGDLGAPLSRKPLQSCGGATSLGMGRLCQSPSAFCTHMHAATHVPWLVPPAVEPIPHKLTPSASGGKKLLLFPFSFFYNK